MAQLADVIMDLIANLSTAAGAKLTDTLSGLSTEDATLAALITALGAAKADKSVTLSVGTGLAGGGDLSANRSITLSPYAWTWATAAARNAQSVVAGDVGRVGFETDMALPFTLLSASPLRWGRGVDPSFVTTGLLLANAAGNVTQVGLNILQIQSGTFGARALAGTNPATARERSAYATAAGAASTAYARGTGGQQTALFGSTNNSLRYDLIFGPGAVTADMRYVYGPYNNLAANVDQAPTVIVNGFGAGADGGNLNIYTADASGLGATGVNLGASFPGVTAGNVYWVSFYSPTGADLRYLVLNLATGAEVSGTISSNIPAAGASLNHGLFSSNHLTASAVSADLAMISIQQRYV